MRFQSLLVAALALVIGGAAAIGSDPILIFPFAAMVAVGVVAALLRLDSVSPIR